MKTRTKKIVMSAMLAALTCVFTIMVKIPTPPIGYLNLGDCVVLLSGWLLPSAYGFASAAVGSALADVISGYVSYAPATFLIKGIMALVCGFGFRLLERKTGKIGGRIISGFGAECVMVLGYFAFECLLYGVSAAAVNIPANGVQGAVGLICALVLAKIFEKIKF